MDKVFLQIKKFRYLLPLSLVVPAIMEGFVEFGIIVDEKLRKLFFYIFLLFIIINIVPTILEKILERQKDANEIITKALDMSIALLRSGNNSEIRSQIFILGGKKNKIKIMFSSSNMENAKDMDIEFDKWQGVIGQAWGYDRSLFASLVGLSEQDLRDQYHLDDRIIALTNDIKSILVVPIKHPTDRKTIGFLSFDSQLDLSTTFTQLSTTKDAVNISGVFASLLVQFNIIRYCQDGVV